MSQVTIYLEPELEQKVRQAAEGEGLSRSKWVAKVLEEKLASSWPQHIKALAGAWPDFPEAEALRQAAPQDVPREVLESSP